MKAMRWHGLGKPLILEEVPAPRPSLDEVLVKVSACGVCRTDLHIVDGEFTDAALPLIPGHEIVGQVVERGGRVEGIEIGMRVGIPWLGGTCGACIYCLDGLENLCERARFTGYSLDGGYAQYIFIRMPLAIFSMCDTQ